MTIDTIQSLLVIICLAVVTTVTGNPRLSGSEQFPQSLLPLQIPYEKTSLSLSGTYNQNQSLVLSATKIPFAGGDIRYNGYLPLSENGDSINQNLCFTKVLGDVSTTFYLSYSADKMKVAKRSSRSRTLTGGVSLLYHLEKRWSLYGNCSIGQTFLTENSIDFDGYRRELYYREYYASDPNISVNGTAGISYLWVVKQTEPYQLFIGLQYDGNWFRPDPRANATLTEYAKICSANFLAFQREEYTQNGIGAHFGVIGPSKMSRTVPFRRRTGVRSPAHLALTSIYCEIGEYWSRWDHRSINYHFENGIIDTSSIKIEEKSYRIDANAEVEVIFLRNIYTGLEIKFTLLPSWDHYQEDRFYYGKYTFNLDPFVGVRGLIGESTMIDCYYSHIFIEREVDTYRISATVSYLF